MIGPSCFTSMREMTSHTAIDPRSRMAGSRPTTGLSASKARKIAYHVSRHLPEVERAQTFALTRHEPAEPATNVVKHERRCHEGGAS